LKNGGYAALSGLSGAIELISEGLYQLLEKITLSGEPRSLCIEKDSLPPDILETFIRRGHITEISHEEERSYVKEVASALHEISAAHPNVVVIPDLDCNYRCIYCFEKPLQSKLKERKTKMDKVGVDNFYRSIDQLASQIGPISGGITLYGGESLSAENKEVVGYIVEKGVKNGHKFFAVTNGHDLDAYLGLLGRDKISNLQITIDGPQSIHDRRRIALDGSSSFQKIMNNIGRAIKETDVSIGVRVNLDGDNYQAFGELLSVFDQEGWLNDNRISVGAAIVDQRDQRGAVFPVQDINKVKAELSGVTGQYPNVEIGSQRSSSRGRVLSSLASSKPYGLRSSYCAASSGMYIFLPDGTISSCLDSLGEECSYIGSYSAEGLFLDKDKIAHRFNRSVANIPACLDCKYCLVCAGGCAQYAEYNFHDIYPLLRRFSGDLLLGIGGGCREIS
jgi:uncharacterized protein